MKKTLIHGATIVNDGKTFEGSVLIGHERIEAVYTADEFLPDVLLSECHVIEAQGKYLLPGVIDTHVHFRDPGLTAKGDMATESSAAVAGGVTSFFDMPNTIPQTTSLQAWQDKMQLAAQKAYANYAFYLGATNDNFSEIAQADFSRICGVKVFMGSSTGNMLVDKTEMLERLFSSVNAVISVHCESEALIKANKEKYIAQYGEELPLLYHSLIRDTEVCYQSSAKAVELAAKYGARLHILHISTAKELGLFDDKPLEDKKITAETCPHYLWFDQDDYARYGAAVKCNPAIKSPQDKEALRKALTTHLLDIVSTDHAPHLWTEKQGTCFKAMSGMPSLQFSLLLMYELYREGCISLENIVEKMCHAPARLFHIQDRGYIRKGCYADLVLLNPKEDWTLQKPDILSKCGWSPYEGKTFHAKVEQTFVNGNCIYNKGVLNEKRYAKALQFI